MVAVDDEELRRVVLQIHDSVAVEIPERVAEQQIQLIVKIGSEIATEMFGVEMMMEGKVWK